MVLSAFEFAEICRKHDYHNFLFSMKASNPLVMVAAYRLLAEEQYARNWDYPLHLARLGLWLAAPLAFGLLPLALACRRCCACRVAGVRCAALAPPHRCCAAPRADPPSPLPPTTTHLTESRA